MFDILNNFRSFCRYDGQGCVPFAQLACYSSPDWLSRQVLGCAYPPPDELVNETVLEAGEQCRSELMLRK